MTTSNNIIEVKIIDIIIGDRFRKEMGDLNDLAQSIDEGQLLQPIGINPDKNLIWGERRLVACRDILGRETIMARIVDVPALLGQFDENLIRKEFTVTERIAIVEAHRSFKHGGDRRSDQIRNCDNEKLAVEDACVRAGFSRDNFYRAKKVEENGIPELVQAMDSERLSIHAAHTLAEASPEEQKVVLTKQLEKATARNIDKQLRKLRRQTKYQSIVTAAVEAPKNDDDIQIHHCPFQNLEHVAGIEPDSVPLILTDIPYVNDFVDQIEELAAFAERVLVSGGTLVAYVGHHRLNEKIAMLDRHLQYRWLATSVMTTGPGNPIRPLKLASRSAPIAVYSKGKWKNPTQWVDTLICEDCEKDWHPWQKPLAEIVKLLSYFSVPGDLVIDPCGGSFTTAIACLKTHRKFIGCDVAQVRRPKSAPPMTSLEREDPVPQDWRPIAS
jgi:ParB-like chromosome segregation protein Spo0J